METSTCQSIKLIILSLVGLSKDAIHIYIGLLCFFILLIVFKKPIDSWQLLIPVLIVSVAMESLDLRDDLLSLGYFRWSASLHDIVNTMFWPLAIVLLFKFRLVRS